MGGASDWARASNLNDTVGGTLYNFHQMIELVLKDHRFVFCITWLLSVPDCCVPC